MKEYDSNLSAVVNFIVTTVGAMQEQAEETEEQIHSTIERLIGAVTAMLRDREASWINDVGKAKHQKEKELLLQKEELEFLLSGIRHAVSISEGRQRERNCRWPSASDGSHGHTV